MKIIFIVFTILINVENLFSSQILLQKNGIIITTTDVENYKNLHNDYHGNEIKNSAATKNLYMIFIIVNKQIENNPKFIEKTRNIIFKDIEKYKDIYSEYILSYFLRYQILKTDFITFYIDQNGLKEIDYLINEKIRLYSDVNCKFLKKTIDFQNLLTSQKKSILNNITKDSILIKKNMYACLSIKNKGKINNLINDIAFKKGYEEFIDYVHKNIK